MSESFYQIGPHFFLSVMNGKSYMSLNVTAVMSVSLMHSIHFQCLIVGRKTRAGVWHLRLCYQRMGFKIGVLCFESQKDHRRVSHSIIRECWREFLSKSTEIFLEVFQLGLYFILKAKTHVIKMWLICVKNTMLAYVLKLEYKHGFSKSFKGLEQEIKVIEPNSYVFAMWSGSSWKNNREGIGVSGSGY